MYLLLLKLSEDGELSTDVDATASGGTDKSILVGVEERVEGLGLDGVENLHGLVTES